MEQNQLNKSDWLALERTKLANERTFLAYFRTFIVIISSGFAVMKIELFTEVKNLGIPFIILSFIILTVGLARLLSVKRRINKYYNV